MDDNDDNMGDVFYFLQQRSQGKEYLKYLETKKRDAELNFQAASDVDLRKIAGYVILLNELIDDIEQAEPPVQE